MKRHFLLAIAVLVIAVGLSAFTSKPKATTTHWYEFVGSTYNLTNLQNAALYDNPSSQAPCSSSGPICGVMYLEDNSDPDRPEDFDDDFKARIADIFNGTVATDQDIAEKQ